MRKGGRQPSSRRIGKSPFPIIEPILPDDIVKDTDKVLKVVGNKSTIIAIIKLEQILLKLTERVTNVRIIGVVDAKYKNIVAKPDVIPHRTENK